MSEKPDCLVADYAGNMSRHCPDGDLFNPKITVKSAGGEKGGIKAKCESCGFENDFTGRENPDGFDVDGNGYFIDLEGQRIETKHGNMPAHYGRRCYGTTVIKGLNERCGYRWSVKECHECGHDNDITARYCEKCRTELVDPNEKLHIEFTKLKKDPYTPTSDKVLAWKPQEWISQAGNTTLRIDFTTEYRTFTVWYKQYADCEEKHRIAKHNWAQLCRACGVYDKKPMTAESFLSCKPTMPLTITACKERGTSFFRVTAYNEDELNEVSRMAT
jgi:DNA repair protein RadD